MIKTLWVVSELYFPEQTSTGYILTQIAEGLAEEYDVRVITGPATNFFVPCTNYPNYEEKNQVKIYRCFGTSFDKNNLIGRLSNLITRTIAIFWKALFLCQKGDVILVVTNPPLLPLIALLLKGLKNCQFVLLIHDVYPEILVATGICNSSSWVVKLGQVMNRTLYQQATKIVTLGRDMSKLAKSKLSNTAKNKIICIPNWSDEKSIKPIERETNSLLQELKLGDRFVVLYSGNLGRTHGVECLAEAAKVLHENPMIHFLVIGFGAKEKWLKDYVVSYKLKNITILPPRNREELIISLNAGDLAIIPFVGGMAGVSVPCRMYNQMAAGKPIVAVADDWSELAQVVKEEQIGWVVQPEDVNSLVNTLKFAATHPEICTEMGNKAAIVAQTKYTFHQSDQAYKKLFHELLN